MQLFGGGTTLYITLAIIALLCVMHVVAYLTRGKVSLVVNIVNITLHILAIFAFLWLKLTISEATLAYLFSLFCNENGIRIICVIYNCFCSH